MYLDIEQISILRCFTVVFFLTCLDINVGFIYEFIMGFISQIQQDNTYFCKYS